MNNDKKYPHKEIPDYSTELFLTDFQKIFYEHTNRIVTEVDDTTRSEAKQHLLESLWNYLGIKK